MIWASRWSVALRTFYRQILSVLYSSFPFGNFRPRLVRVLLVSLYMTLYQIHAPHSISNSWDITVPRNSKPKETTLNVTRTKCSDECVKPSSIIALHWYWIFGIASVTYSQLIGIIFGKKVKLSKLHGEIPVHLINMTISTRFRRLKDIENCKTVFFFESELQLR